MVVVRVGTLVLFLISGEMLSIFHPGKGILIEEVSNHQETLSLAGLVEVFESREGNVTGRKNK